LVLAFDRERETAFMRIIDKQCVSGSCSAIEVLFVFNRLARLSADIVAHTAADKMIIVHGETEISRERADNGFITLNTFIAESKTPKTNMDTRLKQTPREALDTIPFDPSTHHKTLFYLRHILPNFRFLNIRQQRDGNFNADKVMGHLKHLTNGVSKIYYAQDCLLAVAAVLSREIDHESVAEMDSDTKRAIILHRIKSECKSIVPSTSFNKDMDILLHVVSKLSDFVGYLFDKITTQKGNEQKEQAMKGVYRYNIAEVNPTHKTPTDFGHRLAVHFIQTSDADVVSKFSEPIMNVRRKYGDAIDERAVVSRLKNVHSSFYAHSTGYVWDTQVRVVIRKKGLIHLRDCIGIEAYDALSPFNTYSIHDEFPDTFERRQTEKDDFPHSISITCDIQAVIKLKLDSPCKWLGGSLVDYTVNSLH